MTKVGSVVRNETANVLDMVPFYQYLSINNSSKTNNIHNKMMVVA
jgi:hypothetical protein